MVYFVNTFNIFVMYISISQAGHAYNIEVHALNC